MMIPTLVLISFAVILGNTSSASNQQIQLYSISNQEGMFLTSQIKILFVTNLMGDENAALRANHDAGYPDTGSHFHFLSKVNCSQDGKHCKYIAGSAEFIPLQKCTIFETNLEKIILHVDGTDIPVPIESKSEDISGTTYAINNHIFNFIKCRSTFYQVGSNVNGIGQYNVSLHGWLKENITETKRAIGNNTGDYIVPGKTMLQNGNLSDFTFRVAGDVSNPWSPETRIFHNPFREKLKVERVGDNLRLTLETGSYPTNEFERSSGSIDIDGTDNPNVPGITTKTYDTNCTESTPLSASDTSSLKKLIIIVSCICGIFLFALICTCYLYWKLKKRYIQLKKQLKEQLSLK